MALLGGAVAVTGINLTRGGLFTSFTPTFADFSNCGQGLRVGGDVKLRGVLVGRIEGIERIERSNCRVKLGLFGSDLDQIPQNVAAQIRAKTVFGEKWVELLYPDDPSSARIAGGDVISRDRTIDPLEVETILNTALPLLDAIDPEHLAGALEALATGFVGHEDAAIEAMERGIEALRPLNRNKGLLAEGIRQLEESGEVLAEVDDDLLSAFDNLDRLNRFTSANSDLVEESLRKAPELLDELTLLFEARFEDFTKLADKGATVVGVLAARADDLDRLLDVLPRFNSSWIRNLNHVCRHRQVTDEPGQSEGDRVPGRCWRVHNLLSESQGAYGPGESPDPDRASAADYRAAGLDKDTPVGRLLYAPAVLGGAR
ncbi:MAG: MCE family protein [Actinomycetota bacterium]